MSPPPDFLSLDDVLALHDRQIRVYGGSFGVRDMGLLSSAVEMPKATFAGEYLHEDLCAMAAAYLFHIVQNHPFVDGNKRVGLAAAIAFLRLNKYRLVAEHDSLVDMVLTVAQGKANKTEIAEYLRARAESVSGG